MSATTQLTPVEQKPSGRRPDRRRLVLIAVAAGVAVALFATWLVAFSSVFGVRTIEVRGNHALTSAQVRAAADIHNGTPLVRLDTRAVTRRVEQLPGVASAQVSTSFPSTVVITIEERIAVGYLQRAGRFQLLDRTGLAYRTVSSPPVGLPRFAVPAGPGARATAAAVAAVAAALPAHLRKHVSSIEALDPTSITLALTGGRVVSWGSADRTPDKARLLPTLLRHGVTSVDLTDPDQPFTR